MKRQLVITYNWNDVNDSTIGPELRDALEESAWDRISKMMTEGFSCGELRDNVPLSSDELDSDGKEYSGYWSTEWSDVVG